MQTLGQFIVERRKELGLAGREVVAEVRNSDGKPISIPFLVDLEHDRRKPSDEVLEQLAKVLKVDSDVLYFLAGRFPADLSATTFQFRPFRFSRPEDRRAFLYVRPAGKSRLWDCIPDRLTDRDGHDQRTPRQVHIRGMGSEVPYPIRTRRN
jgi:transcriptional regulator with XRE-family HTH domain